MFVDANEGPMTANEDDTIVYFSSLNSCYLVNLQVSREQGTSVSCFTSGNLSQYHDSPQNGLLREVRKTITHQSLSAASSPAERQLALR